MIRRRQSSLCCGCLLLAALGYKCSCLPRTSDSVLQMIIWNDANISEVDCPEPTLHESSYLERYHYLVAVMHGVSRRIGNLPSYRILSISQDLDFFALFEAAIVHKEYHTS